MTTKKNMLFIMRSLGGGGAERVTLDLLHQLDSSRYTITLAVLWNRGVLWQDIPAWVTVIPILKEGSSFRRGLPRIVATLIGSARRANAILGTIELDATYVAYLLGLLTRTPVIGWVHTDLDHYLSNRSIIHRLLVRFCYPRLLRIVSPSHGSLEALSRMAPVNQSRLKIIHNFVNSPAIEAKAAERLPAESAIFFRKPVILGIGRLDSPKGFDLLIKAHAQLLREGLDHNLIILGEGPLRIQLESLINDLNVSDSVFMPGFQQNPYPWLKKAKIFVLSSHFEGFGIVVVEALALGLPIVATNCPSGPAEILDNGHYGILVPPNNVFELAQGISKLLSDDKLCMDLSQAGQKRAQDFSSKNIVPKWENLFQEVFL